MAFFPERSIVLARLIMSQSRKPAIAVALILSALILLPLVFWGFSKLADGDGSPANRESGQVGGATDRPAADFATSQLASQVDDVLENELAAALRAGDVSLDFVADLKRRVDQAESDLRAGRPERARERYAAVLAAAEGRLEAIAAVERARQLKASTFAELQRLDDLRPAFENTYGEAVTTYNKGLRALEAGDHAQSIEDFELAAAVLGDLEARAIQRVATLLEAAESALEAYDLETAREAYQSVLSIDDSHSEATRGLAMVAALRGIEGAVRDIRALEEAGELEAALSALDELMAEHPENPFLENQRASLEQRLREAAFADFVQRSKVAEAAGDYATAIRTLESALELMADPEQAERLKALEARYKAVRLEQLLADGFEALEGARYEAARNFYKEAVALDPESEEARTGLEKASSLYLAAVRYRQTLRGAERTMEEGRYPLASKLFNEAMRIRPDRITAAEEAREAALRKQLEAQSEEVTVTVTSDRRTYVSIIGVLPPERFRKKDLQLYPDVYKVRGTRQGYRAVEREFRVDATRSNQTIEVVCTKQR